MVDDQAGGVASPDRVDACRERLGAACRSFAARVGQIRSELGENPGNAQIDARFSDFFKAAEGLFHELAAIEREAKEPQLVTQLQAEFRARPEIADFYQVRFNRAALDKRFGYAGDFEVIDLILTHKPVATGIHRLYESYFHSLPAVRAVIERQQFMTKVVARYVQCVDPSDPPTIVSVGAGPAREIEQLLTSGELKDADIQLVDTEPAALDYARRILGPMSDIARVRYRHENVIDYCKQEQSDREDLRAEYGGPVNILYCIGVMDYLSDKRVQRLIGMFFRTLAKDGICLVGNFDPQNPTRAYMEWLLQWRLKYRTKAQLLEWARAAAPGADISITDVAAGVNNILVLTRGRARDALPPVRSEPVLQGTPLTDIRSATGYGLSAPTMAQYRLDVLWGLRMSCFIGAILYPLWLLLDDAVLQRSGLSAETSRLNYQYCLRIRLVVMAYLLLFAFVPFARMPPVEKFARIAWLGSIGHLLMGFGLVAIMWILDAFATNYHAGLIMVFIAIATLTPWRPVRTCFELFLIATVYVTAAGYKYQWHDIPLGVWENVIFIIGSAFLLSLATFVMPICRMPKPAEVPTRWHEAITRRLANAKFLPRLALRPMAKAGNMVTQLRDNPQLLVITICVAALGGLLLWVVYVAVEVTQKLQAAANAQGGNVAFGGLSEFLAPFLGIIGAVLGAALTPWFTNWFNTKKAPAKPPQDGAAAA